MGSCNLHWAAERTQDVATYIGTLLKFGKLQLTLASWSNTGCCNLHCLLKIWDVATYISQLVESAEELVEKPDKVLGRALGGQVGEPHNIREQDAATIIFKN